MSFRSNRSYAVTTYQMNKCLRLAMFQELKAACRITPSCHILATSAKRVCMRYTCISACMLQAIDHRAVELRLVLWLRSTCF
jgi:hypothetical protein